MERSQHAPLCPCPVCTAAGTLAPHGGPRIRALVLVLAEGFPLPTSGSQSILRSDFASDCLLLLHLPDISK